MLHNHLNKDQIEFACGKLNAGGLVTLPTETVYGLGADAANALAVQKIFTTKRRPSTNPLIVHLADAAQITRWAQNIPNYVYTIVNKFWPGPLSIVLSRKSHVLDCITGGQNTVALRVPDHPVALHLLSEFTKSKNGQPAGIAAPSANLYQRLSPTSIAQVKQQFGKQIDCYLDGGACTGGIESTILLCEENVARILRPGLVTAEQLRTVVDFGAQVFDYAESQVNNEIRVPGQHKLHYSPTKPLYIVENNNLDKTVREFINSGENPAVICFENYIFDNPKLFVRVMPNDPIKYANLLYNSLFECEQNEASDCIILVQPPEELEWLAVNDRIKRAGHLIKQLLLS